MLDKIFISLIENKNVYDTSLEDSLSIITKHCAIALEASRVSIWLLSEDNAQLHCLSLYNNDCDRHEDSVSIHTSQFPSYFSELDESRIIDADNALTDPRTLELAEVYLKPLDVRSMLDATIRHNGNLRGVICVEMVQNSRSWTDEEKSFVTSVADLISQKLILTQLQKSEANYKAIFNSSSEGLMLYCGDSKTFFDANPAALKMFGTTAEELIGKSPVEFSPAYQVDGAPSAEKAKQYIDNCLAGTPQNFEWQHCRLDGTEFDAGVTLNPVNLSGEETVFALVRDISETKKAQRNKQLALDELAYRAEHDALTGLLNRSQFHNYVNQFINEQRSTVSKEELALLLFDLNRFKEINDTLGHAAGDKVLQELAKLLQAPIDRAGGRLFRLGGDEFVAVFNSSLCSMKFSALETWLNTILNTTIKVNNLSIEMSASIGIAVYPKKGRDSDELLRCADVAMYHTKNNDGASPFYNIKNDLNNRRRLAMTVELGQAIREDQLCLHFQPRVNLQTGSVTGCEALLRWEHPEHGLVFPGEFLPAAEMSNIIHPLTIWVLENAFHQIKHLRKNGYDIPIAVNLSARNLADSQLVKTIENLLSVNHVPPKLLELEITESALMSHPQRSLQNLKLLDSLGVSIALDDFGTGYSSLSYLTKLPLDTVKIDRSFVKNMLTRKSDAVIVNSTINLAHNLSFKVVAEGVEDKETLDVLAKMDCDQAQGYFIAKPLSSEALEEWLGPKEQRHFA